MMEKQYNPHQVEKKWYDFWMKRGYFSAPAESKKPPFSIVIPPPNITSSLHMGHALNNTLQDILARWKRMQGYNALWLPGTDHAGIATQNVVEKEIAKEGLSRQDIGRKEFIGRVWKWKEETGFRIINQLKKLGCSCDWSRLRFTMDEGLSRAVTEVFVRLFHEGYIYQGDYIVNWCPRCETAISDLEVNYQEAKGHLYYVKYPLADASDYIIVATTRPETIFGDVAIAVHPEDKKYKKLAGRIVRLPSPCGQREIPIITDSYVDRQFGTGALKITPAHDGADFEIGQRHNLASIKVIDTQGAMSEEAGIYKGMPRFACREALVQDLERQGYLEKIEDYTHSIGMCYRCNTIVEPYLSRQWFIRMKELAQAAIDAVREGRVKFVPQNWEKIYFQWMENIRDWCISRQIWWGHQIPVWHCENKDCPPIAAKEKPRHCPLCGNNHLRQDEDVLDTWFSSSLWPFSTLGWPEETRELKVFYPTSVLSTGFDIIFFWVARMIIMGMHFMKEVPFHTVYIHALIRDAEGQKMSKSKGNVIDPLEIIEKYGADALRFSCAILAIQGRDIFLSEERIRGYRNFLNKVWNAARLIFMNLENLEKEEVDKITAKKQESGLTLADRWIISRQHQVIERVDGYLKKFAFDQAASTLYEFFWHEFCDWYLEIAKREKSYYLPYRLLEENMRLLHPFIPFITEEIWQRLREHPFAKNYAEKSGESVSLASWPEGKKEKIDKRAIEEMELIKEIVYAVRNIRSELNIPPAKKIDAFLTLRGQVFTHHTSINEMEKFLHENSSYIQWLANLSMLKIKIGRLITYRSLTHKRMIEALGGISRPKSPGATAAIKGIDIYIPLKGVIDLEKERKRLEKEAFKSEEELKKVKTKIASKNFLQNAPPEIVSKVKEKKDILENVCKKLKQSLRMLKEK